ncbi:MAG: phosphotransferase [Lachnospiraceae bacterium]|nr:phosphotransferase [Lachnospiraceae bacterium]
MEQKIMYLCTKYNLGNVTSKPVMITGGLLHKMYRVVTDKGEYAIKVLNPDIMQRPDAMRNMVNSERISHALEKEIPLIAAREFDGKHVIGLDNVYYMVFDWLEGKSVFMPQITEYHCEQIGEILGKIHSSYLCLDGIEKEQGSRDLFDWDSLLEEAKKQDVAWLLAFEESILQIKEWDKQVVDSMPGLSEYQVISHRDFDPKNVMWKDDMPFIIDWEAAGYVNPFQELVEVLNYWTVDSNGDYDKGKFKAMMQAYTQNVDMSNVDWAAVLNGSFDGMLGWLAYNVKRALGLEGSSEMDKREGEEQLIGTIHELKRYEARMEQLKAWLS